MTSGQVARRTTQAGQVPAVVDRVIVHQIDVAHPVPGGIDGAIRGILRFAPADDVVAVVGVLAGPETGRALGRWESYDVDGRVIWFLPVARFDASDQRRRVPHSIRLMGGLVRHRSKLPRTRSLHVHRADTAWASHRLLPRVPLTYFVHTQAGGLSTGTTDSFWGRAPRVHAAMENAVVDAAEQVVVFNPDYAEDLARRNPRTMFSPSWFEPDLIPFTPTPAHPYRIVWLGRLEVPKDPALALDVLAELVTRDPGSPWSLVVVGSGTLADDVAARVSRLPAEVADRVTLAGRLGPAEVGATLVDSGLFLMTSKPGYEGHPRVLIEALASGLPSVVTQGSDTGSLVVDGHNGFVCSRDPGELAEAVRRARTLDRADARTSVDELSGPVVVGRILQGSGHDGR